MLEYVKNNGERRTCRAIGVKGRVRQVVILDQVVFGTKPDLKNYPLAEHAQPCVFTIVERVDGAEGYYVVMDSRGKRFTLRHKYFGANEVYLYDANEWVKWQKEHSQDKLERNKQKTEILESQVALLKGIFTDQVFRVLTPDQAKALGLP